MGNVMKEVRNIDTGEVFKSVREASEKYFVSEEYLRHCCNKGCKAVGCRWEYTNNTTLYLARAKAVKNITTGEVFRSLTEARESINRDSSLETRMEAIRRSCKNKKWTAYKCNWEFVR